MLDQLLRVMLWPGDTIIDWLLTAHPRLMLWLGLGVDDIGGPFSFLLSLLAGWGLFAVMAQLMLLGVQLREARHARHANSQTVVKDEDLV